jgi:ectoine hydroxylase-related dioxygenase (phytanoyl-CoA dioxygenase family)
MPIASKKPLWQESFEKDGIAIIPEVLKVEEAETLCGNLTALELPRSRAGIRHLLRNPVISKVANDIRLLGIAQSILGDNAFPFKATLFDKSPEANWLVTWHQDLALPFCEKHEIPGWGPWSIKDGIHYAHASAVTLEKVVALRLHLVGSTEKNGPLRVLPNTHQKGILSDSAIKSIVAETDAMTCTVEKGGIIVMRPLILHASSKSLSDISRPVLHIEYATIETVPPPLKLAVA